MVGSNTTVALVRIRSNLCDDIAFNIRKWLTNENYGFQQPTSQGLKMIEQTKTPGCLNDPQHGNLYDVCSNRLLVHLVNQREIYLHLE